MSAFNWQEREMEDLIEQLAAALEGVWFDSSCEAETHAWTKVFIARRAYREWKEKQ